MGVLPEEKLLRLIRDKKRTEAAAPGRKKTGSADTRPLHLARPSRILRGYFSLRNLSAFAGLLSLVSVVYLVFMFAGWERVIPSGIVSGGISQPEAGSADTMKPCEFYLSGIRGRTIFSVPAQSATDTVSPAAAAEMIKDLNLVGVISGENAQAVIEDKKLQKTYYMAEGQTINGLTIENIQAGKVTVTCQGQRFELYL